VAGKARGHGYVRLSAFELDRREERRALIAAARANGVEQVIRDGRVYTLVHLPAVERIAATPDRPSDAPRC
jgi:hypothetical protein